MNYCEIVPIISAAAVAISNSFTDSETAVLAAAFTQLGDSLATILAGRALCEEKCEEKCGKNKENKES